MGKVKLCVNVDHIATLRQARGGIEPDPVEGARICENSGASGITVHLREDRRHIQDNDVRMLRKIVMGKFNLEMALSDEIINIALEVIPDQVTIVPEKREELTTEGGLNVRDNIKKIKDTAKKFHESGMTVSLFIEADIETVKLSKESGADYIEIHTGTYCNASDKNGISKELDKIYKAADEAVRIGIGVNAGHGLNYKNIQPVLSAPGLDELNIGHSIISRSVFSGLSEAVREMVSILREA